MGNEITTVAALLKTTPSALMKLKGFGKNSLDEVDAFFAKFNENYSTLVVHDEKTSSRTSASSVFVNHRDEIAVGDFSIFDEMELSETEAEMLQRYRKSYDILGDELVFYCINSTKNIIPIIDMFTKYQNQIKNILKFGGWRIIFRMIERITRLLDI